MMTNLYNNSSQINDNQLMYDSFNTFIFSKERNVFNKLHSKFSFYEKTKHLNGDIVECGVFKGSGLLAWLKLLDNNEPNSIKKVVGFDFFDPDFVETITDTIDKDTMKQVFTRCENLNNSELSEKTISSKIMNAGFDKSRFDLVAGDICKTSKEYLETRPGFRISILNLDLDLDEPTYHTLVNLWDRIVPGGIVIFDEYAYHSWSESDAVDRFVREKNLTLQRTNIKAPTAYIVK